jgi:hypothetical protein
MPSLVSRSVVEAALSSKALVVYVNETELFASHFSRKTFIVSLADARLRVISSMTLQRSCSATFSASLSTLIDIC